MFRNLRFQNQRIYFSDTELSFPELDILGELGRGCNGIVLEALDRQLDRKVALKVWDFVPKSGKINRALMEMRKLANINHPLFVTVHRYSTINGVPFAVLERIPGITAQDWLRKTNPSLADRYALWGMYVKALKVIYDMELLHGDPHTKNILVYNDENNVYAGLRDTIGATHFSIKLTDMGTSLLMGRKATQKREAKVILETGKRIWSPDNPHYVLDLQANSALKFVISALESYANYRWRVNNLKRRAVNDDYGQKSDAISLALELVAVPVYNLHQVVSDIKSCKGDWIERIFLNHVHSYLLEEMEKISNKFDQKLQSVAVHEGRQENIQDIAIKYKEWRKLYLEQELFNHQDPPIWPVFR